jgi:hypothetical protein
MIDPQPGHTGWRTHSENRVSVSGAKPRLSARDEPALSLVEILAIMAGFRTVKATEVLAIPGENFENLP